MKQKIYLDYSSTTPLDAEVYEAMQPYFMEKFGNASSLHSYGRETKIVLEESRATIAHAINAEVGEIFFTSGGTESNNYALIGTAFAEKRKTGKNHIIISAIEHHAVLHTAEYLRQLGYEITILPVDSNGKVHLDTVEKSITSKTMLVSVMHANNEVGTIQPIEEIGKIAREKKIFFHSDSVQTLGKISLDIQKISVDMLSFSAHKIYGPKGIGAIYIRKGVEIDSFLHGGAQERNRRAGTENIPLIVGFAKAVEKIIAEKEHHYNHTIKIKNYLQSQLQSIEGVIINGHPTESLSNIFNISFDSKVFSIEGDTLILNMDLQGIAVSSGSACTSGSEKPSHVLQAMGRDAKTTTATIRFSFGKFTTMEEIEYIIQVVKNITMIHKIK